MRYRGSAALGVTAACMIATVVTTVSPQLIRTDINGDARTDVRDVQILVIDLLDSGPFLPETDLNADGHVDICDLQGLLNAATDQKQFPPRTRPKVLAIQNVASQSAQASLKYPPAILGESMRQAPDVTAETAFQVRGHFAKAPPPYNPMLAPTSSTSHSPPQFV